MPYDFEDAPFLIKLTSLCVASSKVAGKLIAQVVSSGDLKVVNKHSHRGFDPQTEADRMAQGCIEGTLRSYFPNLKIICEEGDNIESALDPSVIQDIQPSSEVLNIECPSQYANFTEMDYIVWVDPLDGTMSFVNGKYEQVLVSIGIATSQGNPVAGILHQPFGCDLAIETPRAHFDYTKSFPRTVWGILGSGIYGSLSRKKFRVADSVILISESHSNIKDQKIANQLAFGAKLRCSGAAYKGLCVLEDEADVMIYSGRGTKKWDTCAIDALFRIEGGRVTDLHGRDLDYSHCVNYANTEGVFCSMHNHDLYIDKIQELII